MTRAESDAMLIRLCVQVDALHEMVAALVGLIVTAADEDQKDAERGAIEALPHSLKRALAKLAEAGS